MSISLAVLNTNTELGRAFLERVARLGISGVNKINVEDLMGASPSSNLRTLEIVVCACLDDIQLCANANLLNRCVLLSQGLPSAETLHSAFALGCIDCWLMQTDDAEFLQRINTVEKRFTRVAQQLDDSAQRLVDMQFELEQDQLQGQQIQRGMLPKQDKIIDRFLCSRWLAPSLILSGDFVDYFPLQDKYLACFLADVAGHGASSALLTVQLKNISWRLQQKFGNPSFNSPGAMLGWINATLIDQSIEKHVAMFLGIIDKEANVLHYSSGAQFPPAMLVNAQGEISVLEQSGKPLGLFADAHYHSDAIEMPVDAQLLVFSDGVLDCLSSADLAEKEAALLQAIAQSNGSAALWDMLRAQFEGVDDMSLMAVKRIS